MERINMDSYYFQEKFRLTEEEANLIISQLEPHLRRDTQQSCVLSGGQQIMIAIRFLATGGLFRLVGDAHGVSPASICRCVHRVVNAINDVFFNDYIKFPQQPEIFEIPAEFRKVTKSNMPCVVGIVDGTHVNIIARI